MGVLEKLGEATKPKPKHKRLTYKEENGTTRVGDALRWMVEAGKTVAPELLSMAGTLTGFEGLKTLGGFIENDEGLSDLDKEILAKKLQLDIVEAQEITKRWEADMASDSWLSKNVRPMTLIFAIVMTVIILILDSSISDFKVEEHWVSLLKGIDLTALGGYFVMRQWGEVNKVNKGVF